jgi:hypothetical protein
VVKFDFYKPLGHTGYLFKTKSSAKVFDTESEPQAKFSLNVLIYTKQADIMKG